VPEFNQEQVSHASRSRLLVLANAEADGSTSCRRPSPVHEQAVLSRAAAPAEGHSTCRRTQGTRRADATSRRNVPR